jgi:hypothetical protein
MYAFAFLHSHFGELKFLDQLPFMNIKGFFSRLVRKDKPENFAHFTSLLCQRMHKKSESTHTSPTEPSEPPEPPEPPEPTERTAN